MDDGYGNAMDRSSSPGDFNGFFSSHMQNPEKIIETHAMFDGLDPRLIGISAPPMKDQLSSLKSRIFQGASKVELGFWGRGKGSHGGGNTTPEMYGKDERQAMRELALVNEVELSFHVAPNIYGWAGLHQNKFSESTREENVREVERTLEFARDVGRGGAVVVHTGEFPRSAALHYGPKEGKPGFQFYPEEMQKAEHYLVNSKTGDLISSVREDQKIWIPEVELDQNGKPVFIDGMKDELGNPFKKLKLDPNSKDVILKEMTFADYRKEKESQYLKDGIEPEEARSMAVKDFYKEQMSVEIDHAIGQAKYMGEHYYQGIEAREDALKKIQNMQELQKVMDPEKFESFIREQAVGRGARVESSKEYFEHLQDQLKQAERYITYGKENLTAGRRQVEKIKDAISNVETIEEFGIKKTCETLARLGMRTYEITQEEAPKDPNYRPMYLAPENIYPESYGAHPQELKTLILGTRNEMKKMLMTKGHDEKEADELSKTHVRATFDIGHVNTWWKYFTGSKDEFKEWILEELDDLIKHDVIGHMHIADNFGFEDEHTTPGQGTAPIKEFVEKLARAGITDMVTEPAHQDYKVMLAGWEMFGGSFYRGATSVGDRWTDISNSYFGRVGSPSFIVGDYAPSQDFRGAPFFSGLPFE